MKKRILLVFLAMVLVVSLVAFGACAKEEEAPPVVEEEEPPVVEEEEPPVVEEVWQWPENLAILSQSAASLMYAMDIAYTTPMAEDTGMKIRIVSEDNQILRFKWVKQGEFFWTGFETLHSKNMIEARAEWATRDAGPFQQRIVYPRRKANSGFAVRGDSDIRTLYDIKPGMKMIFLTLSPAGRWMMEALLAWAGVDPDDLKWVPANTIDTNTMFLMEGKGDVAFGFPQSPIWYEAEAAPHGLRWIELNAPEDPEGAQRFLEIMPTYYFEPMSMGAPSAIGVYSMIDLASYSTRAETDPELVYQIVKWLDENHDKYKDKHPMCEHMTIDNLMTLAETEFIPLHEGTVRYLEEKGLWTAAHEARRQANIKTLTSYVEAYQTAIDMADDQGIEVDPKNESWIELWENYKAALGLPPLKMFTGLD